MRLDPSAKTAVTAHRAAAAVAGTGAGCVGPALGAIGRVPAKLTSFGPINTPKNTRENSVKTDSVLAEFTLKRRSRMDAGNGPDLDDCASMSESCNLNRRPSRIRLSHILSTDTFEQFKVIFKADMVSRHFN